VELFENEPAGRLHDKIVMMTRDLARPGAFGASCALGGAPVGVVVDQQALKAPHALRRTVLCRLCG
jgi:hypothetical protein